MSKVKKLLCQASQRGTNLYLGHHRRTSTGTRTESPDACTAFVPNVHVSAWSGVCWLAIDLAFIPARDSFANGSFQSRAQLCESDATLPQRIKLWPNIDHHVRSPRTINLKLDEAKPSADDLEESLCVPTDWPLHIICQLVFVQSHSLSGLQHGLICAA